MLWITTARRRQRRRGRGRMMTEIVNHFYPAHFAADFLASRYSFELRQRRANSLSRHAIESRGRNRHRGVADVEFAEHWNLKFLIAQNEPRFFCRITHIPDPLSAVFRKTDL